MHSDTTSWLNGQTSEHCGELIDTGHKTILGLAQRFNLAYRGPTRRRADGLDRDVLLRRRLLLGSPGEQRTSSPCYRRSKADNNAAPFPTLYNSFTQAGFDLDHMSLYDWIESRVPGGHASNMGQLLDVAYNIEYGNVTTQQSSLNLVYLLLQPAVRQRSRSSAPPTSASTSWAATNACPRRSPRALPPGTVKLNTALHGHRAQRGQQLHVDARQGQRARSPQDRRPRDHGDPVLGAAEHPQLRRGLSRRRLRQPQEDGDPQLGYGKNAKLQLQFDTAAVGPARPVGDQQRHQLLGHRLPERVGRDPRAGRRDRHPGRLHGRRRAPGVLHTATRRPDGGGGVRAGPTSTRSSRCSLASAQRWNGRATLDVPRTTRSCWAPTRTGRSVSTRCSAATKVPASRTSNTGKCHFAGEHCSTNFQGFMEGGAEEGARAAGEILSDYKAGIFP